MAHALSGMTEELQKMFKRDRKAGKPALFSKHAFKALYELSKSFWARHFVCVVFSQHVVSPKSLRGLLPPSTFLHNRALPHS